MTPTLYGILMQKANYRAPRLILNDERRLISPGLADDSTRYRQYESDLCFEQVSDHTFNYICHETNFPHDLHK